MSNLFNEEWAVCSCKYFNSLERRIKVSNSAIEPNDILKKLINSFCDFLPAPSAILEAIETEHLLNCDIIPNFSSVGKELVTEYISLTNSKLNFHALSCLFGLNRTRRGNYPDKTK
jgi:hypothetical protein